MTNFMQIEPDEYLKETYDFLLPPVRTEVLIGDRICSAPKTVNNILSISKRIAVLYPDSLESSVEENFLPIFHNALVDGIVLPSGEAAKTRVIKEYVEDRMIEKGFAADSLLIVVGGGSVIDLGGFVASTYCRGIPLILIPTTLLSMVDAALGGKNGININTIKNFIGTTHQPLQVIIDIDFIRTLPKDEIANGLVEMAKHALLTSHEAVARLEERIPAIFACATQDLFESIKESVQVKMKIVGEAQIEPRKRHLLNYGHTIGHAVEKLENFQISHGKAVAIGIIAEALLAKKIGIMSEPTFKLIESFIRKSQPVLKLSRKYSSQEWQEAFSMDKKSIHGKARFVMLREPGSYVTENDQYCYEVSQDDLLAVTRWINSYFT